MSKSGSKIITESKIAAYTIAVLIIVFSVVIAWYTYDSQKDILSQVLKGQADRTYTQLDRNTERLNIDLNSSIKRWVRDQDKSELKWREEATDLINGIEGVQAVWLVDQQYKAQWTEPNKGIKSLTTPVFLNDQKSLERFTASSNSGQVEITPVYELGNSQKVVYILNRIGGKNNFEGFFVLEVQIKEFLDYILGDPHKLGYYTKAFSGNDQVFTNGPEMAPSMFLEDFQLNQNPEEGWVYKFYPTEDTLELIISPLPYFIGVAGTIIALLFLLTLLSKQKAKNQSNRLAKEINEKEKIQFELEYLANHDTLTHLPNRHYITNFIETRVKFSKHNNQKFTILFIDLDHFKDINDTLGHAVGDEMLKKLPVLFNKVFRHDDVIARMGGDEFVVYLPGEMSEEHVAKLVERFLKSLEYPIQIEEHLIRLTGSVGVAFYPQHGANVTELLSHADAALYRAKDKGRNTFAIYDSEIEQIAKDRIQLIARLHDANENEEFEMYFQPRYSLHNSQLIGAEALIRWRTETQGVVEPAGFLNLLEETSLIIPISWRMLSECCHQYMKLLNTQPDLFLSFNVSAKLLEHPDFLVKMQDVLRKTKFPPQRLELELTEQTLIQNVENSQYILDKLKQLGISIAIDDFGTGYSSLSYLKNFPVDVLKIDKSFILDIDTDADDLELVKTMIAMGKNLKIITVAEGVENEAQLKLLKHEMCDQVQGYFFKKPMRFYDLYQLVTA